MTVQTPNHMRRMNEPPADRIAETLCSADDTWEHHYATDDYPCSACRAKADDVRSMLAPPEPTP